MLRTPSKNGKEIYEGEIVKFMYNSTPQTEYIGKVAWSEDGLGWTFTRLFIEPTPRKTIKIIGTIYENPELLPAA
ncbi:YopX family protein [Brevibacillus brevis]|uniref:YopX family protein n=1 Tax=Brevibacillus brevis TaxID=1393 RepID=UPI002ED5A09A